MPFRQAGSGVDLDFIPLPDNHQISWLVPGLLDFIDHNMVKPLKIALRQFLQGSAACNMELPTGIVKLGVR